MKKKIIAALLCGVFLLSGCSGKPSGMSDEVYEIGCQALKIIEKYNAAEISADDAYDRIDKLHDNLGEIEEENPDDEHAWNISTDLLGILIDLSSDQISGEGDTFESAANLKEDLGK